MRETTIAKIKPLETTAPRATYSSRDNQYYKLELNNRGSFAQAQFNKESAGYCFPIIKIRFITKTASGISFKNGINWQN